MLQRCRFLVIHTIDLTVCTIHDKFDAKQKKQRTVSIIGLSRHPRMDVHQMNTQIKSHTSIDIVCQYDTITCQTTATSTTRSLRHDLCPPQGITITWCNVTVCSGTRRGKKNYGKLERNLFHRTVNAQDRLK